MMWAALITMAIGLSKGYFGSLPLITASAHLRIRRHRELAGTEPISSIVHLSCDCMIVEDKHYSPCLNWPSTYKCMCVARAAGCCTIVCHYRSLLLGEVLTTRLNPHNLPQP
jgi:hypothetical protein